MPHPSDISPLDNHTTQPTRSVSVFRLYRYIQRLYLCHAAVSLHRGIWVIPIQCNQFKRVVYRFVDFPFIFSGSIREKKNSLNEFVEIAIDLINEALLRLSIAWIVYIIKVMKRYGSWMKNTANLKIKAYWRKSRFWKVLLAHHKQEMLLLSKKYIYCW